MAAKHDYEALGVKGLTELLDVEHAVVWSEVEAKLGDTRCPGLPVPIQPHHLTAARHVLVERGLITTVNQRTRGGRSVPVIVPADQQGRTRAITDAAARKRLLQTRFLTWASGSANNGAGVIGPAGEHVVHAALLQAAPHGYRPINPSGGEVRTLLGAPVPGGPLDNGAFLTTVDAFTLTPSGQYVVLIEVKNLRQWIYPSTPELHQLLDKAARLQLQHQDRRFLPVLVCRRAHFLTNKMAEYLGFYVISTKRQYVPPSVAGRELEEVRTELGYDLEPYAEQPPPALVKHFTQTLQGIAERTATRWTISAGLRPYFTALREVHEDERHDVFEQLKSWAQRLHPDEPAWW